MKKNQVTVFHFERSASFFFIKKILSFLGNRGNVRLRMSTFSHSVYKDYINCSYYNPADRQSIDIQDSDNEEEHTTICLPDFDPSEVYKLVRAIYDVNTAEDVTNSCSTNIFKLLDFGPFKRIQVPGNTKSFCLKKLRLYMDPDSQNGREIRIPAHVNI